MTFRSDTGIGGKEDASELCSGRRYVTEDEKEGMKLNFRRTTRAHFQADAMHGFP